MIEQIFVQDLINKLPSHLYVLYFLSTKRQVKFDVLTSGLVNVTTTTVICCPGFYENHKEKCKSKLFFYLPKRNITANKNV